MRTRRPVACAVALLMTLVAVRTAASAPQGRPLASDGPSAAPVASRSSDDDDANDAVNAPQAKDVTVAASAVSALALPAIDGPAPPITPAVINRDARGRATIRATRLEHPLRIDGRIEEEVYEIVPPITGFTQQVPDEGAPVTEATEVWILYDSNNLYITVRCVDSQPERIIANELRRDHPAIFSGGDNFTVVLDTFYDRRNGFFFQTNPLGGVRDQAVVGGLQLESWNTVWDVKADRFANGWSAEMIIPFKSVRYRRSGPQIWGINLRRVIKRNNEYAHLTPVPASYGAGGMYQLGFAATLVGLETPAQSKNLEVKPYALSSLTTDRTAAVPFRNDRVSSAGFDFKYGLTRSLIADVTVNTDFAQVEEDLQQVNLTRFSLFFPEKRDFFLEGQGLFGFGGRRLDHATSSAQNDVPVLFFSRRIGLSNGQSVPVVAGARVTGKTGPFDVALLNIQTADKPSAAAAATNFSVIRLKRDVLRRSSVGLIATERLPTAGGGDSNLAVGADANFRVSDDVTINAYYARTSPAERAGDDSSYRGRFDYAADRYGLALEHLMVGDQFDPAIGFVQRGGIRRSTATARFSPRLRQSPIRKLTWQGTMDYVTGDHTATVENRSIDGSFGLELHNGDRAVMQYVHGYELLPSNFAVAPGSIVPAGGYVSDDLSISYTLSPQRKLSGRLVASGGSFYDGTKYTASYSGRLTFAPQFSLEPSVSLNRVRFPYADFMAQVLSTRLTVTPTARLMVSSLIQFTGAAHMLSSSVRLRWEYIPGSELFVVYSDGRDTAGVRPELLNRSIAIKVTRLVRF